MQLTLCPVILYFQIRMKGSLPSLSPFPQSLLNYCVGGVAFFRPGAAGDKKLDEVSIRAIGLSKTNCLLRNQALTLVMMHFTRGLGKFLYSTGDEKTVYVTTMERYPRYIR